MSLFLSLCLDTAPILESCLLLILILILHFLPFLLLSALLHHLPPPFLSLFFHYPLPLPNIFFGFCQLQYTFYNVPFSTSGLQTRSRATYLLSLLT
ncbi:hypothetical protein DFH27DRAFT_98158 [Peziza echinospora]|nr:hypothetical protein DFH27DRAFT_98158 [Peziza echinospora]